MKSIANQYRDLKEGRLSQANFMRNLRMMMPQHVTNVTSFNDAVRILKSKNIITEDLPGMASGMHGSKDFQKAMGIEDDSPYEENDDEIEAIIKKMEQEKENVDTSLLDELESEMENGKSYAEAISIVAAKHNMSEDALATKYPEEAVGDKAYEDNYDYADDEYPEDRGDIDDYNDGEFWENKEPEISDP